MSLGYWVLIGNIIKIHIMPGSSSAWSKPTRNQPDQNTGCQPKLFYGTDKNYFTEEKYLDMDDNIYSSGHLIAWKC